MKTPDNPTTTVISTEKLPPLKRGTPDYTSHKPTTGEPEPYPTQEEREELDRYGEPQPEERCHHQWTDYGTLTSGDNPKLDIEACVRCGVQRKKSQSKPTTGEWTVEGKAIWDDGTAIGCATTTREAHYIADAHNTALAAERKKWDKLAGEPLTHAIRKADIEVLQLREQLAVAKGTLEESRRRLERLGQSTYEIDAALAKIGGK